MTTKRLVYLLEKRHEGSLTAAEYTELELWYQHVQDKNPLLYDGNDKAKEELAASEMLKAIMDKINQGDNIDSTPERIFTIQRWSIAAAFMVVAVTSFLLLFFTANKELPPSISYKPLPAALPREVLENQTKRSITYYLEDSSKVILSANSKISFNKPFPPDSREVHLSGKAFFKITRNYKRPFTVYSNHVATTALGTSFTISAFENDSTVTVSLLEGKVVVKSTDLSAGRSMEPVYLQEGEQLYINAENIVAITKPVKEPLHKKQDSVELRSKAVQAGNDLSFNQQPLNEVLNTMADYYGIQIIYDEKEIEDLDFSGQFSAKDEPRSILERIAVLNGLSVTKLAKGYIIRKN